MALGRYLLRRALFAVVLVLAASSAAVVLTLLAPGDITTDEFFGLPPALAAERRAALGLDRPLGTQYLEWLGRAVRFDFGDSLLYSRPVADLLGERARNTAALATSALTLAIAIGVPLGLYTGSRPRGAGAAIVRAGSLVFLSLPPLLASLGLVLLAASTGWLPVGGMTSVHAGELSLAGWLADVARHLPLPALALALPFAATIERLQSRAVADAASEPFVCAARARGLSRDAALRRHAWRASLAPLLGLLGLMLGTLFSGSFVVEVVTAWPGLGRLMFDALRARDLYLVAGCAAVGAALLAAGTLVSDLLLALADPRVRARGTP